MTHHRYPARTPAGQAGIRLPSRKPNLARSPAAAQSASRIVTPRIGSPASATGMSPIPRTKPVTMTIQTTRPMKNPARWWIIASQARDDTRSRTRNMVTKLRQSESGCP
jgi:hypothetical protein